MKRLVSLTVLLISCQQHPTHPPPQTIVHAPPTTSGSASSTTASSDPVVTKKWVPPEPHFKPEASVCKKGVVTQCEFWRAALRQVLKFDPPCVEKDPFAYPWGADGELRLLKLQYPGAKSCDMVMGANLAVRCYFPLRSPSENAETRARALAESFNECVAEEFATPMEARGGADIDVNLDLTYVPPDYRGLRVIWRVQSDGGKMGTDSVMIYYAPSPGLKPFVPPKP